MERATAVAEHKERLRKRGYEDRAVLDDDRMEAVLASLDESPEAVDTPEQELRYIEDLFELPPGYLDGFRIVPAPGSEECA